MAEYALATSGLAAERLHVLSDVYSGTRQWVVRIFLASFIAVITLLAFGFNLMFIATNPLSLCGHRFVRLFFLITGSLAACGLAVLGGAAFGFGVGISDYCVAPVDNFLQFVPAANVVYVNNFLKSSGNNSVLGMLVTDIARALHASSGYLLKKHLCACSAYSWHFVHF